jgi:proteasome lid subunit RPN8/RPN11
MPETRNSTAAIMPMPRGAFQDSPMDGHALRRTMQVYLNENVFMGMVLAAVEVYKRECFGLLLGYRMPGKYVVEHAIPYQTARRGHSWAELRSDKWKVLQEILRNFPKLDVLGDYHSHTMYRDVKAQVSLSKDDIEYMDPNDLQIVIAVNQNKRSRDWSLNSDRTISGSIDKFYFKIAAYYFANRRVGNPSLSQTSGGLAVGQTRVAGSRNGNRGGLGRPRLADILCPFVVNK